MNTLRLKPCAFGLAIGLFWGFWIFLAALLSHFAGYGVHFVESMGSLYIGYGPSIAGSFIGGAMGFVDGFITGAVIAWLYNSFAHCCHKDKCE